MKDLIRSFRMKEGMDIEDGDYMIKSQKQYYDSAFIFAAAFVGFVITVIASFLF